MSALSQQSNLAESGVNTLDNDSRIVNGRYVICFH